MIIFLIHRGIAKAGALSRGHSIPLDHELGKVVTGDTLISSDQFVTSTPLHTPICVYQDWPVLRLHTRMAAAAIPCPYRVTYPRATWDAAPRASIWAWCPCVCLSGNSHVPCKVSNCLLCIKWETQQDKHKIMVILSGKQTGQLRNVSIWKGKWRRWRLVSSVVGLGHP